MATREELDELWQTIYQRLTPEQRRLAGDINARADSIANRTREWATDLLELATELGGVPSKSVAAMFWIRLHGTITELIEEFRATAEIARAMQPDRLEKNIAKYGLAIFEAAKTVLAALDDRDVVLVDYLRQRSVHLRQRGYGLRGVKGSVDDGRPIAALGKKFPIAEVDEMRRAVLREYGTFDAFAVAIAAKVRPAAAELVRAFDELFAAPPM